MGLRRLLMDGVVAGMVLGGAIVMTGARGAGNSGEAGQGNSGWLKFTGKTLAISFDENQVVYGKLVRVESIGADVYLVIDQTGNPRGATGDLAVNTRMIRTVAGM